MFDVYKELKPLFTNIYYNINDTHQKIILINTKLEEDFSILENNEYSPIMKILNSIGFEKLIIEKLKINKKQFYLKVYDDNFSSEIEDIFKYIKLKYSKKYLKKILSKKEENILFNHSPGNKSKIRNRVILLYLVNKILYYNYNDKKIKSFLKLKNFRKYTFSQILNISENLYNLKILNYEQLYSVKISKKEWEMFKKPYIEIKDCIISNYFNKRYHNKNFDQYYKEKRKELLKQTSKENGYDEFDIEHFELKIKVLDIYKDLNDSYEILKNIPLNQLFLLKLFYSVNINLLFKNKNRFLIPLYVLHFAKSYDEARKILFLFNQESIVPPLTKKILGSIVSIIVIFLGNIISLVGLIVLFLNKFITKKLNGLAVSKLNISLSLKLFSIFLIVFGLLSSPYFGNFLKLNFVADILTPDNNGVYEKVYKEERKSEKDNIKSKEQLTGKNINKNEKSKKSMLKF